MHALLFQAPLPVVGQRHLLQPAHVALEQDVFDTPCAQGRDAVLDLARVAAIDAVRLELEGPLLPVAGRKLVVWQLFDAQCEDLAHGLQDLIGDIVPIVRCQVVLSDVVGVLNAIALQMHLSPGRRHEVDVGHAVVGGRLVAGVALAHAVCEHLVGNLQRVLVGSPERLADDELLEGCMAAHKALKLLFEKGHRGPEVVIVQNAVQDAAIDDFDDGCIVAALQGNAHTLLLWLLVGVVFIEVAHIALLAEQNEGVHGLFVFEGLGRWHDAFDLARGTLAGCNCEGEGGLSGK